MNGIDFEIAAGVLIASVMAWVWLSDRRRDRAERRRLERQVEREIQRAAYTTDPNEKSAWTRDI